MFMELLSDLYINVSEAIVVTIEEAPDSAQLLVYKGPCATMFQCPVYV